MTATITPRLRNDTVSTSDARGFEQSILKLQRDLLPQLSRVVEVLRAGGFDSASVREHYAGVCLSATRADANLSARLRFEYENQMFGVGGGQPVFWIFTVHRGNRFVAGLSGRMTFPALHSESNSVIERFFAAVKNAMQR